MQPDDILSDPIAMHFTHITHHDTYPYISPTDPSVDLAGKYYLVSGASKGIGRSIVISLARAGASGIACLARGSVATTVDVALAATKAANRSTPKIIQLVADVSDRSAVEEAAATVEREFGRLDVLVNNAGYVEKFLTPLESDPDDWWRSWEVNVKGTYLMDRAFIPLLLKGGDKTIVTVTSAGALFVTPQLSAYECAKAAQIKFNNHLMGEYGALGLVAYCIHPGGVLTDMTNFLPEPARSQILVDKPELAGDTLVWLTKEKRDWLADRYISVSWDMEELLSKKNNIVSRQLLQVKLRV